MFGTVFTLAAGTNTLSPTLDCYVIWSNRLGKLLSRELALQPVEANPSRQHRCYAIRKAGGTSASVDQDPANDTAAAATTLRIHVDVTYNGGTLDTIDVTGSLGRGSMINYGAVNLGAGRIFVGDSGSFTINEFFQTTLDAAPTLGAGGYSNLGVTAGSANSASAGVAAGARFDSNVTIFSYTVPGA